MPSKYKNYVLILARVLDLSQEKGSQMEASYYITAVHYKNSDDTTFIEKVKTYDGSEKLRSTVVSNIESGNTVMTAYKKSDGQYYKGAEVNVVKIDGVKYIRTDKNSTKRDNLENLPTY